MITMDDVEFIVKEDERKVICIISETQYLVTEFLERKSKIEPLYDWNIFNRLEMPNKFVGVATCSEEDEWSEEAGKFIAFHKAIGKLNRSMFKRFNLYIQTVDSWISDAMQEINKLGYKLSKDTEHREKHIQELVGVEESKEQS